MSLLGLHGALRVNTNPLDPNAGIVRTLNFCIDHPDNFGIDQRWSRVSWRHALARDTVVTSAVSPFSPLRQQMKGRGVRMIWSLAADFYEANKSGDPSLSESEIVELMNDLSVGMTGFNDGVSRYLWLTPNYQWITPVEQWIRVVPDVGGGLKPGAKGQSSLEMNLISAQNYKRITWQYYRRGATPYAGVGTVEILAPIPPNITGTGTAFLSDFIPGDTIIINGAQYRVATITSNTLMTAVSVPFGQPTSPYTVWQRSLRSLRVPVYTFEKFANDIGWGISPWGDNWSN